MSDQAQGILASDRRPTTEAIGWSWRAGWLPPRQRRRRLLRWVWLSFFALCACAVLVLIAGFFLYVRTVKSYDARSDVRADAILTLTGGAQRIDDALQLLARGNGRRMLISGVNEQTTREEIMKLNPAHADLFNCCIDLDYMARNTIGNAIQARRWVNGSGFRSLIVVTSNYHMPRTLLELRHVMPGVEKVPYAVSVGSIETEGWWRDGATLRILISEYAKYLVACARVRFESDPEGASTASLLGKPVKTIVEPPSR